LGNSGLSTRLKRDEQRFVYYNERPPPNTEVDVSSVLIQMGLLIGCGIAWRWLRPGGIEADTLRQAITSLVYYLLLPAMVLSVLTRATLGVESLRIALFGAGTILFGMVLTPLLCRARSMEPARRGAALLAMAFSNVTFLGLPLLEQAFGAWTRALVLQIDFFASSPLLYTLGVLASRRYGREAPGPVSRRVIDRVNPPLLAALVAVLLNLSGLNWPDWLERSLNLLAQAVIPLMLIALGLGLRGHFEGDHYRSTLLQVLLGRLLLVPLFGVGWGLTLDFSGDTLTALVLESAMPCMAMGIVFCDRYRLDTAFYAMVTTLSTVLAWLTLPFWREWGDGLAFSKILLANPFP
jgi:predicted permease